MEWIVVKSLFSLLAVLGLMVGVVWGMRKMFYTGATTTGAAIAIDVLGMRTLQPKQSVYVLHVGDKVLVVGVSDAGMTTLAELESEQIEPTPIPIRPRAQSGVDRVLSRANLSPFAEHLSKSLSAFLTKGVQKMKRS